MRVNKLLITPHHFGFSLIELAVVLVIIGLLLGGLLTPLAVQMENERIRATQKTLAQVQDAILGFAIINKRLPCPDTDNDGLENGPPCANSEGNVPWATLGVGRYDAWHNPLRYRADNAFTVNIGNPADTTSGLIIQDANNVTLSAANPNAPVYVLFSCGADGRPSLQNDADGALNSTATCLNPGVPNAIYTQHPSPTATYDDLLVWITKNTVINQLVSAGRWP